MRIETREVKIYNLSGKNFFKNIKPFIKKCFAWAHRRLTKAENYILKKLDEWGKKADKKLAERLDKPAEEKLVGFVSLEE